MLGDLCYIFLEASDKMLLSIATHKQGYHSYSECMNWRSVDTLAHHFKTEIRLRFITQFQQYIDRVRIFLKIFSAWLKQAFFWKKPSGFLHNLYVLTVKLIFTRASDPPNTMHLGAPARSLLRSNWINKIRMFVQRRNSGHHLQNIYRLIASCLNGFTLFHLISNKNGMYMVP